MTNLDKLAQTLVEPIPDRGTSPYETNATVIRLEDGMAWVQIPGGVEETPAVLAVAALPGDEVRVRVTGGKAYITGNPSAPPTDDTLAQKAQNEAVDAAKTADKAATQAEDANRTATGAARDASVAKETAESSYHIAANTNQYFWHTESGEDTGAHITEIPREAFLLDPEHGGGNLLARSNGIAVREGLNELAVMSADGFDAKTYDSNGDEVIIAHLGYGEGNSTGGTGFAPYYTLGERLTTNTQYDPNATYRIGDIRVHDGNVYVCISNINTPEEWNHSHWMYYVGGYSMAEGVYAVAGGYASHAEGKSAFASGYASHAEGENCKSLGWYSHAEGFSSVASGNNSHAEGNSTSGGAGAHAEGVLTEASGDCSHAEGSGTEASEWAAHAEGGGSKANGANSHAQNVYTLAAKSAQTALGTYNVRDTSATTTHPSGDSNYGAYSIIVGNGTSSRRSNALTVDWLGGIEMYLDHNGTASTDATSGTDKDLFNAIRALGWYSDVIV